ncbi:AAA family ATPase [Microlunatus speluncae]|uniref:AAA family ATPase n=1 Tax=Microlunatus speluncae TaxID=2594267 RepID=UPI001375E899|nr:AAA family ATPase [Microlunatus speluncae]
MAELAAGRDLRESGASVIDFGQDWVLTSHRLAGAAVVQSERMVSMKCTRILFEGYKRLARAECDVNQSLLAFVGPNEAGKSTVLTGLEWLTGDGETELANLDKTRSNRKDEGWIVGAIFKLNDSERALLKNLGLADVPNGYALWKQADGTLHATLREPEPRRNAVPFLRTEKALVSIQDRLRTVLGGQFDDDEDNPRSWLERILNLTRDPEKDWSKEDEGVCKGLMEWISNQRIPGKPGPEATAALLQDAMQVGLSEHPREEAKRILRQHCPTFVLFRDDDRDLPTITPISTAPERHSIRPAVKNLLNVAGISPAQLWRAYAQADSGEVQTILGNGNEKLDEFFGQSWNQSNISVRLSLDATGLSVHIYEIDTKRFTRVEERSDGLRAFVALAAFLEAKHTDVPPILLIDEAESHLHYDAQADLVGVLLKQVNAAQIFYTTHSPGCLPADLGTGIRLVERSENSSTLKSHFWANEAPGFRPLLFAMGAGAAAFSACRWAVMAEGAADMILLPTLLRCATGLNELDYQIAPGLANARAFNMDVEEVAAKVIYLTDGDGAGQDYHRALKQAGVSEERIHSLPEGMATEDLLDPGYYLGVVASMLPPGAPEIPSIVASSRPIAKAVVDWGATQSPGLKVPGKIPVAYRIIERDDIKLRSEAKQALRDLHTAFTQIFRGAAPVGVE